MSSNRVPTPKRRCRGLPSGQRASWIVKDDRRFVLLAADRDAFLRALLEIPKPTKKLIGALRRHREATW